MLWLGCLGLVLPLGCQARGRHWQPLPEPGRDVIVADRLSFALPPSFHETTGGSGRTFRERGSDQISYSTIHVDQALVGAPLGLDEAFGLVMNRLRGLDHFELIDVQLAVVGDALAIHYAADFEWLDLPRRQWGTLVSQPDGLIALFMSAPNDHFAEAADDFYHLLASLHALP